MSLAQSSSALFLSSHSGCFSSIFHHLLLPRLLWRKSVASFALKPVIHFRAERGKRADFRLRKPPLCGVINHLAARRDATRSEGGKGFICLRRRTAPNPERGLGIKSFCAESDGEMIKTEHYSQILQNSSFS